MSFNLPNSLPKAEIRCNICTQRKSTQRNSLSKSDRIEKKLEIITADIIGPFEVDTFNKGSFLLTICDVATGFSKAKLWDQRIKRRNFLLTPSKDGKARLAACSNLFSLTMAENSRVLAYCPFF